MHVPAGPIAVLAVAAAILAGCTAGPDDGTQGSPPPASLGPQAPDRPGRVDPLAAAADACLLLAPSEIERVAGVTVDDGVASRNRPDNVAQCTYTTQEEPLTVILTAVSLDNGANAYDVNVDIAPSYFGGDVADTQITGAERAYTVVEQDLDSPVVGMLVDGVFVRLQLGITGADADQASELAELMAARLS